MITILKDEQYRIALLNAIREATREILISTFKMDYSGRASKRHINAIVEALHRASERGVRVLCLLSMDNENSSIGRINMRAQEALTKKGILVKTGPEGRTYHAKLVIIDEKVAFAGSHNLSESSLCRNFEISLMITSYLPKGIADHTAWERIKDLRQIYLKEWGKGR